MAVTIAYTYNQERNDGLREIEGTVTMTADHTAAGMTMDISAKLSGSPKVKIEGNLGYVADHNKGTASAGKILVYEAGADADALDAVANSTDISNIVFAFSAVGTAV